MKERTRIELREGSAPRRFLRVRRAHTVDYPTKSLEQKAGRECESFGEGVEDCGDGTPDVKKCLGEREVNDEKRMSGAVVQVNGGGAVKGNGKT